ncbi:[FeFe] hydrogenase, group A [Desulfotomaculum copahuensis]|uniref:Hydrogenase n=1 Tax=Desulfotomaculum copahuensis TaxID=1838280 RepID=A0A1B7LBW3_9FIRM|nr:[FeFe] hydrogenase, group A [Desulfotomaculum copahuensis]OAT80228.1 hydrogenase [Desulfotomaculum copahuensis]
MSEHQEEKKEITRRTFLKMMAGLGLAGLGGMTALPGKARAAQYAGGYVAAGGQGWLPYQYNVPGDWQAQVRGRVPIDDDNPSIVRDDNKCILCGQCLETCKHVESVFGYYKLPIVDKTICIHCGQCSLNCPTGAISERSNVADVLQALQDKSKFVLAQTAPATRVALGEEFGLPPGSWVAGQQVSALRGLGFKAVTDTVFTADLTIMEEATELLGRIKGKINKPLPQFTSCSPGWIKFCEYFYPDLLPHMSSCKSPQQMLGALAKTYYARRNNIDPASIVSVSIMPCTAKKFECSRPEMDAAARYWNKPGLRDVDYVLTTRELAQLLKARQINLTQLPESDYDRLLGEGTGAGIIFGASGGVMEAALRTAYFSITGQKPPAQLLNFTPVRGLQGVKEAAVDIPGAGTVKVAVCQGMASGRQVLEAVRRGQAPWVFVEFMTCPGGCISGGGQPRSAVPPTDEIRQKRAAALYSADQRWPKRDSFENDEVMALYKDFLGHPLGELSEKLLHTEYLSRAKELKPVTVKIAPAASRA